MLRIINAIGGRQPLAEKRIEQAMLGTFELLPARQVLRQADVGYHPVVSASNAECFRGVCGHQPIACAKLSVRAIAIALRRIRRQGSPSVSFRLECRENSSLREEPEPSRAALA